MLISKLKHICKLIYRPLSTNVQIRKSHIQRKSSLVYAVNDDRFGDIKIKYFTNRTALSATEWQTLRDTLMDTFKHINSNNLDATIIQLCNKFDELELAKNYIKYLESSHQQPNAATLGKLLKIYNAIYHKRGAAVGALNAGERAHVLQICSELRGSHNELDSLTCENVIFGLITTDKWRESLPLLDMISLTSTPSLAVYSELALKAFGMHDVELGYHICEQMLKHNLQPKPEIFHNYLNAIIADLKNFEYHFEQLLNLLQKHNVFIDKKVASFIEEIAQNHKDLLVVKHSELDRFGKCSVCSLRMKNEFISDDDFQKLSNAFMEKVLIGNDIFQKSMPKEVESFMNYITQTAPYDCVIDGLNVAYSVGNNKTLQELADLLVLVVKHFVQRGKHVLVLGRQHMNKWPRTPMQYVKNNASMFLTNDLSQDDPFLLYATLKSGKSTDFFSRDLMRQHAYLLGTELKGIFRRWQQIHQYSLSKQTKTGRIIIKKPLRYVLCAHQLQEGNWHIPYKMEYSAHSPENFHIQKHWLCLKLLK